jgi:hypothetical protein
MVGRNPCGSDRMAGLSAKRFCIISTIFAALMLIDSGCAPRLKTLVHESSFTADKFRRGGLALLGTVGLDLSSPTEGDISLAVDSVLWRSLTSKLTNVDVWPSDSTRSALTSGVYNEVRFQLGDRDEVDPSTPELLRSHQATLPAYLLLARIEQDRTWDEMNEDGTEGTGYRHMKVRVNIYDVSEGKLVWATRITHGDYRMSKKNEGIKLGPVQLGGDDWDWRPPPPSALEVLGKIYEKLGEALATQ